MDNTKRLKTVLTHIIREGHDDQTILNRVATQLVELRNELPKEQGGTRVNLESRPRGVARTRGGGKKLAVGTLTVEKGGDANQEPTDTTEETHDNE